MGWIIDPEQLIRPREHPVSGATCGIALLLPHLCCSRDSFKQNMQHCAGQESLWSLSPMESCVSRQIRHSNCIVYEYTLTVKRIYASLNIWFGRSPRWALALALPPTRQPVCKLVTPISPAAICISFVFNTPASRRSRCRAVIVPLEPRCFPMENALYPFSLQVVTRLFPLRRGGYTHPYPFKSAFMWNLRFQARDSTRPGRSFLFTGARFTGHCPARATLVRRVSLRQSVCSGRRTSRFVRLPSCE